MSSESYSVRVFSERLVFSAGHFITLKPGLCESLHGHDYRLGVELSGPLDENRYVVDFMAVQEILLAILADMDHRVLLPTRHPAIRVETVGEEVHVRYEHKRWILPACDACLLPVDNTTTELLARYIGGRLRDELHRRLSFRPEVLRVEITERYGQSAACELR